MRRAMILTTLLLTAASSVQAATPWIEGQHYFLVSPPQPTAVTKGKVEVLEVFSYGCTACNHFYPVIDKIKAALPANAQMRYLPASWHPEEDWKVFQRAYFAALSLGIADKLHDRVFDAVWKTGELATMEGGNMKNPLPSLADVAQFYEREAKLKPGEFLGAAHSFSVDAQMRQADEQIKAYQTDMTPTLIIDGKYRLTPISAGGSDEFVALAKSLVDRSSKKVQPSTKAKSP